MPREHFRPVEKRPIEFNLIPEGDKVRGVRAASTKIAQRGAQKGFLTHAEIPSVQGPPANRRSVRRSSGPRLPVGLR